MSIFSNNFTLAVIQEVGENDVLLSVNNEEFEVTLTDNNREDVLQAVQDDVFILPFNQETNEIMTDINEEDLKELFPEFELDELQGATDELPDELQDDNDELPY